MRAEGLVGGPDVVAVTERRVERASLAERARPGLRIVTAFHDLRAEIASDRERDLQTLAERMAEVTSEYGERRETDGYLSGMRTATTGEPPTQNVRSLRPKR